MNKLMIGAAALAVAIPALAQMPAPVAPPAPPAPMMAPRAPMAPMAERIHTRDQVAAKVRDHFARLDTNRDGFIGGDEMQAGRGLHQDRRARRLAMRDPNATFDRLDANRDGMINRDEFARGRQMLQQRRIVMHGQPGGRGAPGATPNDGHRGMMKMHRMGGMMRGHMLRMADLDRDGRVSLNEATASALQHFDRMDTNRDGRLTPDERRSGRQMMRQMRRAG